MPETDKPERQRRTGKPSRRMGVAFDIDDRTGKQVRSPSSFLAADRRRTDRNLGRLLRTGDPIAVDPTRPELNHGPSADYNVDRRVEEEGNPPQRRERRVGKFERRAAGVERRWGAGRRSDDMSRALKTGESVIFDMSKVKSAGKLAKKAAKSVLKKAGPLGAALTIGGIASQAKAATQGITLPKTQYKGEKNLLPAKPKIRKM